MKFLSRLPPDEMPKVSKTVGIRTKEGVHRFTRKKKFQPRRIQNDNGAVSLFFYFVDLARDTFYCINISLPSVLQILLPVMRGEARSPLEELFSSQEEEKEENNEVEKLPQELKESELRSMREAQLSSEISSKLGGLETQKEDLGPAPKEYPLKKPSELSNEEWKNLQNDFKLFWDSNSLQKGEKHFFEKILTRKESSIFPLTSQFVCLYGSIRKNTRWKTFKKELQMTQEEKRMEGTSFF
jgi:hypothetical protein